MSELKMSVGSKVSHPPSMGASASTETRAAARAKRFIGSPSTFALGGGERHQHLDAGAGSGRRLRVGGDHVEPAPGPGGIARAPGGERQQFAGGVTEGAIGCGQRLEQLDRK